MLLLTVALSTIVAGALVGWIAGRRWVIRAVLTILLLWVAAFLGAAWLQSEPATTILGWSFIVALPAGCMAIAAAAIGEALNRHVRPRGAESEVHDG
jgi:hypothetical protein